jgi:hypothetical protein
MGTPPPAPILTFVMEIRVRVGAPEDIGGTPRGRRRIVPILAGQFDGPRLRGQVLPGGADWQLVRADGFSELDARYVLETDGGEKIFVQNAGIRHAPQAVSAALLAGQDVDPALVYFRTVPTFETAAPDLQWLTRSIFVALGERHPSEVVIRVWSVD